MSLVTLLGSLIVLALVLQGTQAILYHGLIVGLGQRGEVTVIPTEISSAQYNVSVHIRGEVGNSTLNLTTRYNGEYYYLVSKNGSTLSICYYSANFSKVQIVAPFYLPFQLPEGNITLKMTLRNSSEISAQLISTAHVNTTGNTTVIIFKDLNITEGIYLSFIYRYNDNYLTDIQSNYSFTDFFLENNVIISPNHEQPFPYYILIIPVVVVIAVILWRIKR
ncbi:hypothetical protein HS7_10620 [Sulfolobales archaeon HS-7]|nr:hypothetical protein HS7_10620 [Sulfolobales archaeon HS-7]